ncbi:hypothetical protein P4O66_014471, partial [Electrophorus voltai]
MHPPTSELKSQFYTAIIEPAICTSITVWFRVANQQAGTACSQ